MQFRCRLGTPEGQIIEGVYAADSEARLRRELEDKGLLVLGLQRLGGAWWGGLGMPRRGRIPTREFVIFNQELATLLKAGMPLVQSLDILRRRLTNPVFKSVMDDVHERVRAGSSLSEAFEVHGKLFPGVYTASLLAGEKSGSLEQVIRRYITYVKVVATVRRRTLSALVYPAILLVLSMIVVGIIVLWVVPEFQSFYEQFGAELPLSTRIIVAFSSGAGRYFLPLVITLTLIGVGAWRWAQRPGQRERIDGLMLRIPGLGSIARKFATSQAARTLATLLSGGIPLVNAVDVSARAMRNQYMARELRLAAQQVREGRALAVAMADSGAFPDVAVTMVEVGESTGSLQEMLNSLADFYDEDIETNLGRFVTLVEPILLVVMGLVIAGLLLALYMPLFSAGGAIR